MSPTAAFAGLLFGLSLIVAIGPQNAFVLQRGALRRRIAPIVGICAVSDAVLIAAGVGGMGAAVSRWPGLLATARDLGVAVLAAYATVSARRAARPPTARPPTACPPTACPPAARPRAARPPDARPPDARPRPGDAPAGDRSAILACLAFTWLNPAVYLDTVVLLGSVAGAHPGSRWSFGAGAAVGSVVWFAALGYGAGLLQPVLARARAGRCLDGLVAAVMALTAVRVLLGA